MGWNITFTRAAIPQSFPKTAIITPFGLFEYLFMPFGLSNVAQTFQRIMDHTVVGLEDVFAYMDDSRVGSPDRQYLFSTLPHKLNFVLLLMPPILISTASCSRTRATLATTWFFSKKLTNTESRYSTFEHELLAAHAAIRHFHHFCEGHGSCLSVVNRPQTVHDCIV
jgi:hypothetical protein